MEGLEKGLKELKEFAIHRKNNMNQSVPPEFPGSKLLTKGDTWRDPWL